MKMTIVLAAALMGLIPLGLSLASAQTAEPIVSPSSIWYEIWLIIQPIVVLLVSTVGPIFVAWISAWIIAVLKVTDEKKKLEVEAQLRDALHKSALNALKYAITKSGIAGAAVPLAVNEVMVANAVDYVIDKNPETIAKLGVDGRGLRDIILSKVPDVLGLTTR